MTDAKNEPVMCAGPHLDVRLPKLKLLPKSADCHCHVFGPRDQYPWAANRLYTPPPVLLDDYLAMLRDTGFERGVMVQRSEEHTSELQSRLHLVCRLLLEKKKKNTTNMSIVTKKKNKTQK